MKLSDIADIVDGYVIVNSTDGSPDIVSVCSTDLMSDVLRFAAKGALLVTALNQSQVIRTAEIADIAAVLMVMGKKMEREMIELAKEKNIALMVTHLPAFTVCGMLYAGGLRSCLED
jgi:predicted transcriptional regulator